jgi:hypothetical protein
MFKKKERAVGKKSGLVCHRSQEQRRLHKGRDESYSLSLKIQIKWKL